MQNDYYRKMYTSNSLVPASETGRKGPLADYLVRFATSTSEFYSYRTICEYCVYHTMSKTIKST